MNASQLNSAVFRYIGFFVILNIVSVFAQSKVKFAVIGDYGVSVSKGALEVSKLVKSWNPEFIVTTGDNTYTQPIAKIDDDIGKFYAEFIFPYKGNHATGSSNIRTENAFFPTLGNHDWVDGANQYLKYFAFLSALNPKSAGRYYDFQKGPVHFFMLDSDRHEPDGTDKDSVQAIWLKKALEKSTAPWKIVMFHHSPYTSGKHDSAIYMRWPFKEWGADLVLTGHDHLYERLKIEKFPYIINGLGGHPQKYEFRDIIEGSMVRYNDNHGAQIVKASDSNLHLDFYAVGTKQVGPSLIDTLDLKKKRRLRKFRN